jgi:transposase-like protein
MASITVNQQQLEVTAAAPDMVAAIAQMLPRDNCEPQSAQLPTGKVLAGVIYVFSHCHRRDTGALVVEKLTEASQTLNLVAAIHREIILVRDEHRALKTAKQRLEQMQVEKLFAFTDKIDPSSFRILCAVLAQGDVAKASRSLNIKDTTLRKRMADWKKRGSAYRVLDDLVRWRKTMGRKGTVSLNEAITSETAAPVDYAGLLSDVLDELLEMDDENWEEKVEALAAVLRPHVPR